MSFSRNNKKNSRNKVSKVKNNEIGKKKGRGSVRIEERSDIDQCNWILKKKNSKLVREIIENSILSKKSKILFRSNIFSYLKYIISKHRGGIRGIIENNSLAELIIEYAKDYSIYLEESIGIEKPYLIRNRLQSLVNILREIQLRITNQYIVIKAESNLKFVSRILTKYNKVHMKLRAQSKSRRSLVSKGKWINIEELCKLTKIAQEKVVSMIEKYKDRGIFNSTNKNRRLSKGSKGRSTSSWYLTLPKKKEAIEYQTCFLWLLFGYWTVQRTSFLANILLGEELDYDYEKSTFYVIESSSKQKNYLGRVGVIPRTLSVPDTLHKVLMFQLNTIRWAILPKALLPSTTPKEVVVPTTDSEYRSWKRELSTIDKVSKHVLVNMKGNPLNSSSILHYIKKFIDQHIGVNLTLRDLRLITQTQFFLDNPDQQQISQYNYLADHSEPTSWMYYKATQANTR